MAWDLRGNMGDEIERAVLLKTLTPEQVAELFPPYPADHPVIVNKIGNGSTAGGNPYSSTDVLAQDVPLEQVGRNVSLLNGLLGPLGEDWIKLVGGFGRINRYRLADPGK